MSQDQDSSLENFKSG